MGRGRLILAIETSCDETAAAVVRDGRQVLSNVVASQVADHTRYGGVVPEIASRAHLERVFPVIRQALAEAYVAPEDLTAVGVTHGPGLVGSLLVGVSAAKALAYAWGLPLIAVNHLVGHVFAGFLSFRDLAPPLVCLLASGGHTAILHLKGYRSWRVVGQTRDDAAGEAFDKVARLLDLGYPGGPALEECASHCRGNPVSFPRAWLEKGSADFSFSGIKTAVQVYLQKQKTAGGIVDRAKVALGFQESVVEVLTVKTLDVAERLEITDILVVGGVAANRLLRENFSVLAKEKGLRVFFPPLEFCTDNAAMIGAAADNLYCDGERASLSLNAVPGLGIC